MIDARLLRALVPLLVSALFVAGVDVAPLTAAQRVTFRADDGVLLAARWYDPSVRPAPAVILVHMLHRSHRDWDQLASRLARDGIGALAIDLRGHGESHGRALEGDSYAGLVLDVRAARRFLAGHADVQQSRVGMAGASIGANVATLEAAADKTIASLALLSPSLDYRGLRIEPAMRSYGSRPALLVAGDDDAYAARSARELQKGAGTNRELLILPHAGHGTEMLRRDPELLYALVDWFRRTL